MIQDLQNCLQNSIYLLNPTAQDKQEYSQNEIVQPRNSELRPFCLNLRLLNSELQPLNSKRQPFFSKIKAQTPERRANCFSSELLSFNGQPQRSNGRAFCYTVVPSVFTVPS
jgi:hypothetical protein